MAARLIRLPRLVEISRALETDWHIPLRFAVARRPLPLRRLTPAERARLGKLQAPRRKRTWLLGRAALKRLLASFGEPTDTGHLRFPHPRFSLTHTDTVAVAVGTTHKGLAGVGIDLEVRRAPPAGSQRFFLSEVERRSLRKPGPDDLRRLWTIKEACFKADPGNAQTTLRDYVLRSPLEGAGPLRRPGGILFCSFPLADGCLSVAVMRKG